jgi:hypothetical protein
MSALVLTLSHVLDFRGLVGLGAAAVRRTCSIPTQQHSSTEENHLGPSATALITPWDIFVGDSCLHHPDAGILELSGALCPCSIRTQERRIETQASELFTE